MELHFSQCRICSTSFPIYPDLVGMREDNLFPGNPIGRNPLVDTLGISARSRNKYSKESRCLYMIKVVLYNRSIIYIDSNWTIDQISELIFYFYGKYKNL